MPEVPLPRWRVLTWAILVWIVVTLVAAFQFAAQDQACLSFDGFERLRCQFEARSGFRGAVGWLVIGTIILGTAWIVTRPRYQPRHCPACGSDVMRGLTECDVCGHDFAAAARRSMARRDVPPGEGPAGEGPPGGGAPPPSAA